MRNNHVAEPFRSIVNAASPGVSDERKCCMCHQPRPAMRWIECAWWCVECSDQFTADMESVEDTDEDDGSFPGDECGRWENGRLGQYCGKAGTEECDFECPYRDSECVKC